MDRMLAAMTSREVGEWQAFFAVENEVTPEDEVDAQVANLGYELSSAAVEKLKRMKR